MSLCVTVTTGDRAAEVFAFTMIEGMPLDRKTMLDFGAVPPHSEMEFAVFDGRDILVREVNRRDEGTGKLTLVSGDSATTQEAA
ncbi:MAG: hypothetical protein AAFZ11_00970 [Pseudomonadota bacterium]